MDENIRSAIQYGLEKNGYTELRPNQGNVLTQLLNGRDVLFCSPTGSGKSLIFEVAPFAFQYLNKTENKCTCIVVSPLAALMKSKAQELKMRGTKTLYLRDIMSDSKELELQPQKTDFVNNIHSGKYELIFASPETLLQSHREEVLELSKQGDLKGIFIDEAHCIKKFGKPDAITRRLAYRPMYGCLGELRSLAGPTVPVVALTATASEDTRKLILKDLCMSKSAFQLVVDPNKRNIKYWVFETGRGREDICDDFDWLVNLIRKKGKDTPRMLVFFRKIDHISDVFEHLATSLGQQAYVNFTPTGPNDDRNRLFDMYHLKTDEEVKEAVAASYQDPEGVTRVVLCSTSFSMGLDVKGVNAVIHYGASNDLDDYIQESGRAGRRPNEQCHAIIMKYKRCLSSKNIAKSMKEYINSHTCRRKILLKPFTTSEISVDSYGKELHNCCDVCASSCTCQCVCDKEICKCDTKCISLDSEIYSHMIRTCQYGVSDETESGSSADESDFEGYIARKPQVLNYSSDEDY